MYFYLDVDILRRGRKVLSRVSFKISVGFLLLALTLLAGALSLSYYYLDKQGRLTAAGDLKGAMDSARKAERLDPFSPDPLEAESYIQQQQGHVKEAADSMRQAAARDPNNYAAYLFLGNLQMYSLDKLDAAGASYRKALRLNPKSSDAIQGLAQALLRKGDLKGSRKQYEKLKEEKSISPQGLYDLGRIYVRTGKPVEGEKTIKLARRRLLDELKTMDGSQKTQTEDLLRSMTLAIADALVVQGNYDKARSILENSDAQQAPAILQLLNSDPEGYRKSVENSAIY